MLLSYVILCLRAWRRYQVTRRELALLSDHELADLGLTRSQISSAAYRCAWEADSADPRLGHAD